MVEWNCNGMRHFYFYFVCLFNIPAWFCGACLFILFLYWNVTLYVHFQHAEEAKDMLEDIFTICCMFNFPFWFSVLERYQCFSLSTYLNLMQSLNPVYGVISYDIIWWRRYRGTQVSFSFLCNTKHPLKIMSLYFLFSQMRVFSIEPFGISIQEPFWGFEHLGKVDPNWIFKTNTYNYRM